MALTKIELNVASSLLKMASDTYSNHGCNDFEMENTQENVDLLNAIEKWNVRGEGLAPELVHTFDPSKKTLLTYDWLLMSYLSSRLEDEAEDEGYG